MSKHLPIIGTRPTSLCDGCGVCCEGTPGAYAPEDFFDAEGKLDVDALFEAFSSGEIVLGVYDGDPRSGAWRYSVVYYPRPQFKNKSDDLVDNRLPDGFGGCTFLTENGCKLSFEDRPTTCRTLAPSVRPDGEVACHHPFSMGDKQFAAAKWLDHYEDLLMVAELVEPDSYWRGSESCP